MGGICENNLRANRSKDCHFAGCQQSCQKDVEGTLGVIQAQFAIFLGICSFVVSQSNVRGDASLCDRE
jgi:hypothetical protein